VSANLLGCFQHRNMVSWGKKTRETGPDTPHITRSIILLERIESPRPKHLYCIGVSSRCALAEEEEAIRVRRGCTWCRLSKNRGRTLLEFTTPLKPPGKKDNPKSTREIPTSEAPNKEIKKKTVTKGKTTHPQHAS